MEDFKIPVADKVYIRCLKEINSNVSFGEGDIGKTISDQEKLKEKLISLAERTSSTPSSKKRNAKSSVKKCEIISKVATVQVVFQWI